MNRRDFITAVGTSAGSVYAVMKALDLLETPASAQNSRSNCDLSACSEGVIPGAYNVDSISFIALMPR